MGRFDTNEGRAISRHGGEGSSVLAWQIQTIISLFTFRLGYMYQDKSLTESDLTLILDVLNESFDDVNLAYLHYEEMYKNSPSRKPKIEGMKRMVDKHSHAIEIIESLLRSK